MATETTHNDKFQKYLPFMISILSFLISLAGIVLIMKARGLYPFKETTLFVMDMRDQFLEFYASLRYLFSGDSSVFFSWSRSMGGNFIGLLAYYVANPISLITVFFSLEDMPLAIAVLSALKVALCGLTFSVYANYLFQNRDSWNGAADNMPAPAASAYWTRLIIIPLSVSYALISYNITYLLCLMWIDGVIFLPLVLLGAEKILSGKKGLFYTLALTGCFFCNYYTGYMVGLFTALYVLYRTISRLRKGWIRQQLSALLRFTVSTLLAVGLSAPLLLAVIQDLFSGKFAGEPDSTVNIRYNYSAFSDLHTQFLNGAYKTLNIDGMPAIYCGIVAFAFAILFFFMKKINLREKLGALILLFFLAFSFYYYPLDVAWHGFQRPNCFPNRYAFVFSFLVLYMAARAACCIPWNRIPNLFAKKPLYELIVVIIMVITAADLGVNGRDILFKIGNQFAYDNVSDYTTFLASTKPLTDNIKEKDNGLYRINQCYEYSKNDSMLLGYNGMTHYSSTFNQAINDTTFHLGIAQVHFWNSGYGSTPITDSLFGIRYILSQKPVLSDYKELQRTEYDTVSYANPYALPFVYSAPAAKIQPDLRSANPFDNQNTLLNNIANTNTPYFITLDSTITQTSDGWSYTTTTTSDNPLYFYLKSEELYRYDPKPVLVNGEPVGEYFTSETICIVYLGEYEGNTPITVTIPGQALPPENIYIAELQMDKVIDTLSVLQENGIAITKHRGSSIRGTITVDAGEKILTSIPYDTGWTVKIDGRRVPTETYADTFLCLSASPGEHTITFSYVSPGFYLGLIISFISLICSIFYFKKRRHPQKGGRRFYSPTFL